MYTSAGSPTARLSVVNVRGWSLKQVGTTSGPSSQRARDDRAATEHRFHQQSPGERDAYSSLRALRLAVQPALRVRLPRSRVSHPLRRRSPRRRRDCVAPALAGRNTRRGRGTATARPPVSAGYCRRRAHRALLVEAVLGGGAIVTGALEDGPLVVPKPA